MFDKLFNRTKKKKENNPHSNDVIRGISKQDIIVGIALNNANAGDVVQIQTNGIYNLKRKKSKKLLGKMVDEEKTELEKWFEIFDMEKKDGEDKLVNGYTASTYLTSGSVYVIGSSTSI